MTDAAAPTTTNGVAAPQETPGHKVFAGNLAYTTTDEGLKTFFAPVSSDIISAQVILRGSRSAGYGFVAFSSSDAAEKAVAALDKKELDGRIIIVEVAKPAEQKDKEKSERRVKKRSGRRGSKAPTGEVTEAEANGEAVKSDEAKADGTARPKKKKAPRKPRDKKAAVEGDAAADADAAPKGDAEPKKRTPRPRTTKPRTPRPEGEAPAGEPSKSMLFVANLGFSVDDAGLTELFTNAGINVVTARVIKRRWGHPRKSKGYGFVDVGTEEEQKKAIEVLQGKEIAGREIAVKVAVNSPPDEGGEEGAAAGEVTPETTVLAT